jgi:hypothetical protein
MLRGLFSTRLGGRATDREVARHVVSEHPEAMDILANYDPDDENPPPK